MIKKAIIPAAGFGTRSLPITKVIPKEMFPVGLKPAIEYVIDEAIQSGIEEILIIVSRSKNIIVDYFDPSSELESFLEKRDKRHLLDKLTTPKAQLLYTRQPYARGLGDAIRLGKNFIGDDAFAVLLPDDIIIHENRSSLGIGELINAYNETGSSVIGLKEVESHLLKNYGVIKGKEIDRHLFKVEDIVEKPQTNPPSNLAVIGRYVFTSEIMQYLENLKPGQGNEIQLTDAIKRMLKKNQVHGKLLSGERFDIGIEFEYFQLLKKIYEP